VTDSAFDSIVVGTDGSATAATAVRQAIAMATGLGARLQIVSAYEPPGDQRLGDERTQVPADVQWAVGPHADALELLVKAEREAILDVAEEQQADLIVIGNKGMTGAERFLLGSVPNKVSHHAPCSVLIVRTT